MADPLLEPSGKGPGRALVEYSGCMLEALGFNSQYFFNKSKQELCED